MELSTTPTLKVVIVEEDEYFAMELTMLVKKAGYPTLASISNMEEAVTTIHQLLPDIIIMAIDSAQKNEILNQVRSFYNQESPLLIITNYRKDTFYSAEKHLLPLDERAVRRAIKNHLSKLKIEKHFNSSNFISNGFLYFSKKKVFYKIKIADILYFKARDDYSIIHTENQTCEIYLGLNHLKKLLAAYSFVTVHRSYFVNAQKNITVDFEGCSMYISYTYKVPISRRMKKNIIEWFEKNNIPLLF